MDVAYNYILVVGHSDTSKPTGIVADPSKPITHLLSEIYRDHRLALERYGYGKGDIVLFAVRRRLMDSVLIAEDSIVAFESYMGA